MAKYDKETKFYWLQLKEDFFEEDSIEWLEEQENGHKYSLFYLKLCLKSLKSNGILIRKVGNMLVPYDNKKLAEMTKTPVDTVIVAMELLKGIGLVKVLENGELYITQLENMIGSTSKGALKKQQQRAVKKQELLEFNEEETKGGQMSTKDKDKIKDKIKDIDKDKVKHKYGEYQRIKLTDKEYSKLCDDFGKEFIDNQIKLLDEYVEGNNNKNRYSNFNLVLRKSIRENWFKPKTTNNKGYTRTEVVPDWFKQQNDIIPPDDSELAELDAFTDELEPFEVRKQALQEKLRSKYGKNASNTIIN